MEWDLYSGAPVGSPVAGVVVMAVWAVFTVVGGTGAFLIVVFGVFCTVVFLVSAVGGIICVFLTVFLVGIGGLTITMGLLGGFFVVVVVVFLVVVGAGVVVGFLLITNSADKNKTESFQ